MKQSPNPSTSDQIIMYSTSWCPDCQRARRFLDERQVPYLDVDIEEDADAMTLVKKLNHGNRSVPTIVFPDGSMLVEPSPAELASKVDQ